MVMQDLPQLPDSQMQNIRADPGTAALSINITSAYPLDKAQREALCQSCRALIGREVTCEFLEDRNLIAGVRISVGSWVLRANVEDELSFFAESLRHA